MFVSKFIVALAAAASSAAAQMGSVSQLSDSCKSAFVGIVSDAKLNSCLPLASVAPFVNKQTTTDASALNSMFMQMCSAMPCQQSLIDSFAGNLTTACASDLAGAAPGANPARFVSTLLSMYTPMQKAGCYVDEDKQFCLAKTILALNIDLSGNSVPLDQVFSNAKNLDVCTKCNQHIVGTFGDFMAKNPAVNFPIPKDMKDKVVGVMGQKCGNDFAQGVAAATDAPFPNAQKQIVAMQSSAAAAPSLNAFAVFALAGVALTASF